MESTYLPMTEAMCEDFAALACALGDGDRARADLVAAHLLEHCEWDRFIWSRIHYEKLLCKHHAMPRGWVLAAGDGQALVHPDNVVFVLTPMARSQGRVITLGGLPAGLHDLADALPLQVRRTNGRRAHPRGSSTT